MKKTKAHISPGSHSVNIVLGEMGLLLYAKYCAKWYLVSSSPKPCRWILLSSLFTGDTSKAQRG